MGVFPEVALPTHPPTGLNFLLAEQMLGHRLKKGSALTKVNVVQYSQELAFTDSEQKVQAIVFTKSCFEYLKLGDPDLFVLRRHSFKGTKNYDIFYVILVFSI